MGNLSETVQQILGLDVPQMTTVWQMGSRAVVVYILGLGMVRLVGERRFIGKYAAFDVVLGIIFGATLSRAINGSAPFLPTLVASLVLTGMHWLFSVGSFHFAALERLLKGEPRLLVSEGQPQRQALRKSHITQGDLKSAVRLRSEAAGLSDINQARLECSGEISVVLNQSSPQILEVETEAGVQTIRIQLQR